MTDVDVVRQVVLAISGVAHLHPGPLGTAATYLPGRRVGGIALRENGTEIHIALVSDVDIAETAGRVHGAVMALGVPQPVRVYVEALMP